MATLAMRKSTGTRRTASGASTGKSRFASNGVKRYPRFALCIDNDGNPASLQLGKVYEVIKPDRNDLPTDLRVVDEDGEDYIYSARQFVPVDLPPRARKAVRESVRGMIR